jgi:hypothetical protein
MSAFREAWQMANLMLDEPALITAIRPVMIGSHPLSLRYATMLAPPST